MSPRNTFKNTWRSCNSHCLARHLCICSDYFIGIFQKINQLKRSIQWFPLRVFFLIEVCWCSLASKYWQQVLQCQCQLCKWIKRVTNFSWSFAKYKTLFSICIIFFKDVTPCTLAVFTSDYNLSQWSSDIFLWQTPFTALKIIADPIVLSTSFRSFWNMILSLLSQLCNKVRYVRL